MFALLLTKLSDVDELRRLEESNETTADMSEYSRLPAVILLSRIYPSSYGSYDVSCFIRSLLRLITTCRIEKLRHIGVSALMSITEHDYMAGIVMWISTRIVTAIRQNAIHGLLLIVSDVYCLK